MNQSERQSHELDKPALFFKTNEIISEIKKESPWTGGDKNAITLVKSNPLRVTLISLKRGAVLSEHHAPGRMTLFVIKGKIKVKLLNEKREFATHEMLSLQERIPHSVEALEETDMLLTIIPDTEHKM